MSDSQHSAGAPVTADVRQYLSKILKSSGFSSSDRLSRFLQTIVDKALAGQGQQIKESVIGIEVFDRKPGYDHKSDPIVRVQAHRLRTRLANYYEKDGANDAIHIDIPKGGYLPVFRRVSANGGVADDPPRDRGLVVLPFVNLSQGDDNEYFADGLTEELINALTQVRGLRVVGRTSSFAFKGKAQDIREIGRTLGVGAVLEGGVRRTASMLRVTVQLVNASDGYQIWANRYDRRIDDVFSIQEDIAQSIVEALKVEVSRLPARPLKTYTRDSETHALYLKGRYWFHRWTTDNSSKAIASFEEAIRRDPSYAPAYSGLADSYFMLGLYGPNKPASVLPRARAAVEHALEIDDELAEAHCSSGLIAHSYDWDTERCRLELERSLSLNPGYALARSKYGVMYLLVVGRMREAIEQITSAVDLDPLSPQLNSDLTGSYLFAKMSAEALTQGRKTLELDPSYVRGQIFLLLAHAEQFSWEESIRIAEEALKTSNGALQILAFLGYLYGRAGNAVKAAECERRLTDAARTTYVSPLWYAAIYAGLNERDQFFAAMDKACDDRAPWIRYTNRYSMFMRFTDDPRYERLLKRLRLVP